MDIIIKAALKFCNNFRKTPVLESLFNKSVTLQACIFRPTTLLKRDCNTGVFLWILQNFWEHLKTPSKNIWKMFGYEKKSLKRVIINFHVFMRKPVQQICAEQLISGVEFQIGQNNRYEIYPDMNLISFLNM